MKKWGKRLFAVSALAAMCAGGTAFAEEEITLTYMGWLDNNEDGLRAVADLYEEANPNVKIEIELLESDQYDTVYMARMASGEAADLMSIRYQEDNKKNYASGDYVADLTGQPAVGYLKEGLDQVSAYEGEIQGIPVAADCWGLWYNADMLEKLGLEVPTTIGEFRNCCETAKEADMCRLQMVCRMDGRRG